MVRQLSWLLVIGCLSFLAGCGKSNDSIAEEMLGHMNDLSSALEAGDKNKLKSVISKMGEMANKYKDKKDSKAENDRMQEKYKDKFAAAAKRMQEAMAKAVSSGKFTPQDLMEMQTSMTGMMKR